jgi:hypothetical protein
MYHVCYFMVFLFVFCNFMNKMVYVPDCFMFTFFFNLLSVLDTRIYIVSLLYAPLYLFVCM